MFSICNACSLSSILFITRSHTYIYTHITGNNSYNLASLNSSRSCILVGSKTCSAVNENAFCDLNLSNINAASIFLSCLIDSA